MSRSHARGPHRARTPARRLLTARLRTGAADRRRLRDAVDALGSREGLAAELVTTVQIVLDEIVSNVFVHGATTQRAATVSVVVARDGGDLTIEVEDDGAPFDPLAQPPPDLERPLEARRPGGVGVHLVRHLMDEARYERRAGRNRLLLRKRLAGAGAT